MAAQTIPGLVYGGTELKVNQGFLLRLLPDYLSFVFVTNPIIKEDDIKHFVARFGLEANHTFFCSFLSRVSLSRIVLENIDDWLIEHQGSSMIHKLSATAADVGPSLLTSIRRQMCFTGSRSATTLFSISNDVAFCTKHKMQYSRKAPESARNVSTAL